MTVQSTILITGGAGFIGRHVVEYFVLNYPNYQCVILDSLTYSGHLRNLASIAQQPNFTFIQADINDFKTIQCIIHDYQIQGVIHLAAETHVDNSIQSPIPFVQTNVLGTANLLEACRNYLENCPTPNFKYLQISTDEVFGSINKPLSFDEQSIYRPRSPYSASKASADHVVMSYHHTYQFPAIISYTTNNYGPYQHPEKLIPHTIANALVKKPIPIYGTGQQIRNWIAVPDHVRAIDLIFHHGIIGETYAISAHNEYSNLDVVTKICLYMEKELGCPAHTLISLITHVKDRPGHDFRYALNSTKIEETLHWQPLFAFDDYLIYTINWYINHPEWLQQ
ncbi:MAG: dTDP-glucose 4,6-dehydratase [Neisseriaceae bacterium]|nr:MAG: dTDP-glucose 4,6-dehydratase [Neisseriaceae bacterium]